MRGRGGGGGREGGGREERRGGGARGPRGLATGSGPCPCVAATLTPFAASTGEYSGAILLAARQVRRSGHPSCDTAVCEDVLAIDPRPVLRAEEPYDIGDIFGLAQPTKRRCFGYAAKRFLPVLAQELGIDSAW